MRKYTSFSDIQEVFDPIDIDTENESLEDNELLQELVDERTQFNSWQEMFETAVAEYAKKQLFAGIWQISRLPLWLRCTETQRKRKPPNIGG